MEPERTAALAVPMRRLGNSDLISGVSASRAWTRSRPGRRQGSWTLERLRRPGCIFIRIVLQGGPLSRPAGLRPRRVIWTSHT